MKTTQRLFLISEVCHRTGVNPVTLRAWERRYGLLKPKRTDKGHRLYSEKDITLIEKVLSLLHQGIAISQIKPALKTMTHLKPVDNLEDHFASYKARLFTGITHFDHHHLDKVYNELLSLYPMDMVTVKVIIPLLDELGKSWQNKAAAIAEEHFFSVYLRNKIGARLHHQMHTARGHKVIFGCLPKETHEFGLLLFALYCIQRQIFPVILGQNLPISELSHVCKKTHAQAIILKGHATEEDEQPLDKLSKQLKIPIFLFGSQASPSKEVKSLPGKFSEAFRLLSKSL